MHDPGALPAELFDTILEYLNHDESSLPYLFGPQRQDVKVADLRACSLVSRAWYRRATLKLYSRFKYAAYRQSFSVLWQFLRTVVEKPRLGANVQHLDLREYPSTNISDPVVLNSREERSRRHELRALYAIGSRMGFSHRQLFDALLTEARQPFEVLLICCLPNVSSLYLSPSPDLFHRADQDCLGMHSRSQVF